MAAEAEIENGREVLNFNTDWLFSDNDYVNGSIADLDDSAFTEVSIPHANKILEKHTDSRFQRQIDSYRFNSWYRRHFALPEEYTGKRIMLEFEGVATVADVYVNGEFVQRHRGAYTSFEVDITDYVKTDGSDNVVAVKVDSNKHSDIPPEGGSVDYCLFGGIVREVNMIITEPLYMDNVFVSTPELSAESGVVNAQTKVVNTTEETKNCTVETIVLDAEGNEVTRVSSTESIAAGETFLFDQTTEAISNPHLWNLDDPYLYTVKTNIMDDGEQMDELTTNFGFRWFEFTSGDEDASFYLNGEKVEILGVNRHEQWPWIGRAVGDKLQAADADLIKETGFNAVRCSHYPQDPAFLTRCDEIGLIVFEEAPGWNFIGDEEWQEVYKTNVAEMIVRDRNHASIVTWGTRVNESNDNDELYTETNELAKTLDPTRPTHGVRGSWWYEDSNLIEDIFTVNYQYPEIPRLTPFIISEHSEDWYNGDGFPGATDEAAVNFAKSFAEPVDYYFGNDLCAGGFAWSMFDYNNEVNYTDTDNVFYSGVYSLFRLEKPAAYLYKSQKDPETDPMVYIANYWTEDSPSTVTIMSNCDEVELFVNGTSVGKQTPNLYMNLPHPMYEFENVAYSAGEIKAVGYIDGEVKAEYTQLTPGEVAKLVVTPDYETLTADGSDLTSVTIMAVDENGTVVPYADNTVMITLEGAGKFIGEETIALEGGKMTFLVQSEYNETGAITCTVSSEGVEEGSCAIEVVPFEEEIVPVSEGKGSIAPTMS